MSNDYDYLKSFTESNGSTTQQGQSNASAFEKSQGWQPAPQQSHESHEAYMSRVNSGS